MNRVRRVEIKTAEDPTANQARFYWRRESLAAVKTIIQRFSHPGDTILDPFCGSGTTGLAAAALRRKAILSELSPAVFLMAKALNEKIPDDHMKQRMKQILTAVWKLEQELYGCACSQCGPKNAGISYSIYETTFREPYFEFRPLGSVIFCKSCRRSLTSKKPFAPQAFSLDITSLRYDQIFSTLNKTALQRLKRLVDDYQGDPWIYPKLNTAFMFTVYQGSLYRQKNGVISMKADQGFPALIYEKNCCHIFAAKLKSLERFNHTLPVGNKVELHRIQVAQKPAWDMANIENNSIDLCYYDIPYGSDFIFSHLNGIWEVWLGQKTDPAEEIYFMIDDQSSYEQYGRKILPVFKEAFRVLKPGRNLVIPFSSRYDYIYPYIEKAVLQSGFRIANPLGGGLADHIRIINGNSRYYLLHFGKP